jgi:hypothetical protein
MEKQEFIIQLEVIRILIWWIKKEKNKLIKTEQILALS